MAMLPKVIALPVALAMASGVSGSTFGPIPPGFGGALPAIGTDVALSSRQPHTVTGSQVPAENVTLTDLLSQPQQPASALPLMGDDALPSLPLPGVPTEPELGSPGQEPVPQTLDTSTTAVPEPPTWTVLALAGLVLALLRRQHSVRRRGGRRHGADRNHHGRRGLVAVEPPTGA